MNYSKKTSVECWWIAWSNQTHKSFMKWKEKYLRKLLTTPITSLWLRHQYAWYISENRIHESDLNSFIFQRTWILNTEQFFTDFQRPYIHNILNRTTKELKQLISTFRKLWIDWPFLISIDIFLVNEDWRPFLIG